MKSKIWLNGKPVAINKFPGGEVNVNLKVMVDAVAYMSYHTVFADIKDSDGIMALLMVKDIMDRTLVNSETFVLLIPYVPYGRQDRVCAEGDAFSLKVFANIINSMNFDKVVTIDNHSDVTSALINNVRNLSAQDVIGNSDLSKKIKNDELLLVAPDAGATKKIQEFSKPFVQCLKSRNPATGQLSGFRVCDDVEGKDLLIVDDICDGGGTFIGLTKELLDKGAKSISLYVTHGIFSKGVDILYDAGISEIYTMQVDKNGVTSTHNIKG